MLISDIVLTAFKSRSYFFKKWVKKAWHKMQKYRPYDWCIQREVSDDIIIAQ